MTSIDRNVTSVDSDQSDTEPRLALATDALYEFRDSWVTLGNNDTIQFDIEEAARIALQANDAYAATNPEYCRWACHTDEQDQIVENIVAFFRTTEMPVLLLDALVGIVEGRLAPIMDTDESTPDRTE